MKSSFASILIASSLVGHVFAAPAAPVVDYVPAAGPPQITFVDQVASLVNSATNTWHVNLHGYIATPVSSFRIGAATLALKLFTQNADQVAMLNRRMKFFSVGGASGQTISVDLAASVGGERVKLPTASDSDGRFDGAVDVALTTVPAEGSSVSFVNVPSLPSTVQVGGNVYFVGAEGYSIISDIDDTIKISEVNSKTDLIRREFLEPFVPVQGMADAYNALKAALPNTSFHYLSRSPWNLYGDLAAFGAAYNFPAGQFLLRDFSLASTNIIDFFTASADYKTAAIKSHLALFPKRQLVMIGDSTEMDPESYGPIARSYPANVACIAIRIVTGVNPTAEASQILPSRFTTAFAGVPVTKWFTFTDARQLSAADIAAGNCRAAAI